MVYLDYFNHKTSEKEETLCEAPLYLDTELFRSGGVSFFVISSEMSEMHICVSCYSCGSKHMTSDSVLQC